MKIAVLGYSGSGQSTLSKYLSQQMNIPCLHFDAVYFEGFWEKRNPEEARQIVATFMKKEKNYITDGNFRQFFQAERLKEADYIIFLLFPRWKCLYRAFKRFFYFRNSVRDGVGPECIETMNWNIISWLLFKARRKRIRRYNKNIVNTYQDKVFVIKNQCSLDKFKRQLKQLLIEKHLKSDDSADKIYS